MDDDAIGHEGPSLPALLRRARTTYGAAMRRALDGAGYDDIPKSGLFVIGALALEPQQVPLSQIIDDLGLSKQAAGQLVDTLVARGYLQRQTDPQDRRRLTVTLTERGRDAARVQTGARQGIDRALTDRVGNAGVRTFRKVLAALCGLENGLPAPQATAPAGRVLGAVPILFVRDVAQSARFFADQLGFTVDFLHGEPPFYGAVSRGGVRIHLRFVAKPNFSELAAQEKDLILATVEVADVRALYAEFEQRGVAFARGLVEQVWGGTDFHIRDPDGNEISFVEYRNPHASDGERL